MALFTLFVQHELQGALGRGNKAGMVVNVVYAVDLICRIRAVAEPGPSE